jgi:hypothetical protein
MSETLFEVDRVKAEAPLFIIAGVTGLFGFLASYSFGYMVILATIGILLTVLFFIYQKLTGPYFVRITREFIEFRLHIFQTGIRVPWQMVDQVNFHLYEINFRIKTDEQDLPEKSVKKNQPIVNLQTNYLNKEDREILVKAIKEVFYD